MKRWFRRVRSRVFPQYVRADLHSTLQLASPDASIEDRLEWLASLIEWARLPATMEALAQKADPGIEATRVRFLLAWLDRHPELKDKVAHTLQSILVESRSEDLFFASGIEIHQGFLKELFDRVLARVVPQYRDPHSLKQTFEMLFTTEEDIAWLRGLSEKDVDQLSHLGLADEVALATFRAKQVDAIAAALIWLAARMVGLVVESDLRGRLPTVDPQQSSFFRLQFEIGNSLRLPGQKDVYSRFRLWVEGCYREIEGVYPILETTGVSVDLVYKLESLKSILRRISLLAGLHDDIQDQRVTPHGCMKFLAEIGDLHLQRASLSGFLGSSFNMIARKIVERTSETGEHYITRTREEYNEMFASASGGGVVTVFTTAVKSWVATFGLPLFFEGFFTGLNYAVSFVAIQLFHFTLGTKTPAMTASTLAGKLRDISSPARAEEFVQEVIAMHRGAFIAVMGNMGWVIPGVAIFDLIWRGLFGHHFYDAAYAVHQLELHSPFESLTIWYAIVTGFILWSSSIIGAWVENWMVYRRQFEVFENSPRLRWYFGEKRQQELAAFLKRNASAFGSNISLGFMLAFCGIFGKFFGVPLDVRHVTLSSGTLTFAMMGVPSFRDEWVLVVSAVLGIGVIATLNFGVSFMLSLFVAARARNISLRKFPLLVRLIWNRFRQNPKEFYFVPKTSEPASPAS